MAVDRKQQMKEIKERLEQGVKDIFTSEMYTTYLRTMAKFHNYSFNNTLLIAMQRPDATLVAGFNAWKNKFNRYVKKGEKGIQNHCSGSHQGSRGTRENRQGYGSGGAERKRRAGNGTCGVCDSALPRDDGF